MQSRLNTIRRGLAFLLVVFCAPAVLPQSHNREAMKWFDAGLAEKNVAKRIEAYSQAVDHDPNFAEALFNLGTACKEQQSYDRAEQFLRRAANAATGDLRVKALSELASIYNIRGHRKSAESALREAKTLSGDPKQRAALSYELGRLLYQHGRYEQAADELKDGRAGDPAKRESFDYLIKLAENSAQLDYWYVAAEKQKAAGRLQEAKATLEQIKAKNANFRDAQTKLNEIETLLADANQAGALPAGDANQAKTLLAAEANQAETLPAADANQAAALASEVKTEMVTPVINADDAETEKAYAEGLLAFRKRDWLGAIAAFEQVLSLNLNYRDAREKLHGAQFYFERDRIEAIAARYYDEGVAAMNRNDLDSALVALGKVHKINRRYREVAALYAQVEAARGTPPIVMAPLPPVELAQTSVPDTTMAVNQQAGMNESPDSSQFAIAPLVENQLDSLYQLARGAMARGDWNEAVFDLQKIRMLQAGYRDVDQLFPEARAKLLGMAGADDTMDTMSLNRSTSLFLGGLAVVVLAGFALCFLFLSPVGRARLQRWRGNDNVAALIYESLLARRPSRMKLYPAVAEIYLKMNRRDAAALQIYRRVLELNLPSAHRADMNAIVALHTVYEKSSNGEVIAKTDSFISEAASPGSSVLLADSGFQIKKKTPARRPRQGKVLLTPAPETTAYGVAENGVAAPGELLMGAAFSSPAKPRKPRKKKAAAVDGSAENGDLNGMHWASSEPQLAATPPVKKPRRKKVTVVDSINMAAMTSPVEVNGEAAPVDFYQPQAVLDEATTPAVNEPASREEMFAA